MYYGNIKNFCIENGTGVRVSLFVSGCRNQCPGCFQKQTWDFKYGKEYTEETQKYILRLLSDKNIDGLSILGGEPFEPENQPVLSRLILETKKMFPNKTIWMYTGCILEKDILQGRCYLKGITEQILSNIDVLVDGPFIESKKNLSLAFRGSTNQRILYKNKNFS